MTTTTQLHSQHDHDSPKTGACCQEMHDEIAMAAHGVFVKQGSMDGHDVQNWLDAEIRVKAQHANDKHAHHDNRHASSGSSR